MPKQVYARVKSRNPQLAEARNTHRQCAERVLLGRWLLKAWKHGVTRPADAMCWMRRKCGNVLEIVRPIKVAAEEKEGCSAPCVLCRRALAGWLVEFRAPSGHLYSGSMSGYGEKSVLTSGWRRALGV